MEQEEAKLSGAEAKAPTAEQLESLKKKLAAMPAAVEEAAPSFNEELAALCKKHGIVALFGAVQLDEAGSAGVVSFRADPWKRIGLADLGVIVARKALDRISASKE